MNYYIIEPEVAGEIGENTLYDNCCEISNFKATPLISHLHFVFEGWLGDELLEVTPCFLISERLRKEFESRGISGCDFSDVEISYNDVFWELYPDRVIPKFYRLIPLKTVMIDNNEYSDQVMFDIMLSQKKYLVISEKVKKMLTDMGVADNSDYTKLKKR